MNRQQSKSYRLILAGVLQILAALVFLIVFLASMVLQFVASLIFRSGVIPIGAFFLVTAATMGILLYRAVGNLGFSERCSKVKKYLAAHQGQIEFTLEELSDCTRRPAEKLSAELQVMAAKEYLPVKAQYDPYRQLLVVGAVKPFGPPEPEFGQTIQYKEHTARSKFPIVVFFYTFAVCWIFRAGPGVVDFIFAAVLSAVFAFLSYLCTAPYKVVSERSGMPSRPVVHTGDKDTDNALESSVRQLEKLAQLGRASDNPKISGGVAKMITTSREILGHVKEHPEKMHQIRQFLNYYLPTTLKLLDSYDQLSRHEVKGANVSSSLEKIEGMVDSIVEAFQQELDNLYYDKAVDISTEIEVMKSMLDQEGMPFGKGN